MPILPAAALAQHIAVLGKTGSGKSYAVKGIVEWLLTDKRRVGIVDPTGAWFGLRSSADGRGPGFPILVLGGDHGDLPLPALGGAAVARLLVDQGINLVADTSMLTVGERTRWFIDFATTLHRLNRSPLHLVLDEAHMFAPQGKVPDPDTGRMLHAANTLASGGRSRGIRLAMITQRPQKLHKDALTSADTLIAMRVLAPQDRLAVEEWIKGCGDIAQGKEVLNSLASLQRGEGWIWHPEGSFLKRVKFPPITTFDSSATPTDGHAAKEPKGAAEIDLTEIRAALADAVREAEENDPRRLKAEIARLNAQVKRLNDEAAKRPAGTPELDRAALVDADLKGYGRGRDESDEAWTRRAQALRDTVETLRNMLDLPLGLPERRPAPPSRPEPAPRAAPAPQVYVKRSTPEVQRSPGQSGLDKPQRAFLAALAQHGALARHELAVFAGYSAGSRHVDNTLATLRSAGYVNGDRSRIEITEAGQDALGSYDPLPTGKALQDYWFQKLDTPSERFLRVICAAHPGTITRAEAAVKANYSPDSRHVDNTLATLRVRRLITGPRTAIKASDNLFG